MKTIGNIHKDRETPRGVQRGFAYSFARKKKSSICKKKRLYQRRQQQGRKKMGGRESEKNTLLHLHGVLARLLHLVILSNCDEKKIAAVRGERNCFR